VTVYFDNGKTNVDPKYNPNFWRWPDKAKAIEGLHD